MGSSQTRDWTHISCTGRWILNHWSTREALLGHLVSSFLFLFLSIWWGGYISWPWKVAFCTCPMHPAAHSPLSTRATCFRATCALYVGCVDPSVMVGWLLWVVGEAAPGLVAPRPCLVRRLPATGGWGWVLEGLKQPVCWWGGQMQTLAVPKEPGHQDRHFGSVLWWWETDVCFRDAPEQEQCVNIQSGKTDQGIKNMCSCSILLLQLSQLVMRKLLGAPLKTAGGSRKLL